MDVNDLYDDTKQIKVKTISASYSMLLNSVFTMVVNKERILYLISWYSSTLTAYILKSDSTTLAKLG